MNSEIFKAFIKPYVEDCILLHVNVETMRANIEQLPSMLSFYVGHVCGQIFRAVNSDGYRVSATAAPWRDMPKNAIGQLTQEEVRRVFDYVRLRLETGSATS